MATCNPRGLIPRQFCDLYGFPTKSFAHVKYGVDAANKLAQEWARRGEFCCQLWVAAGRMDDFDFPAGMDITDDLDFVNWALTLDHTADTWAKAAECRRWRPVRHHPGAA
jgi:hypothetical protein